MSKKIIVIAVLVAVLIAGGMFYAGMKYQIKKGFLQGAQRRGNMGNRQNVEGGQRNGNQPGRMAGNREGGGFASGEIIAKDEKSITIKMRDGGSKIVFLSDATQIGKITTGVVGDLSSGLEVMVNGKSNPDGSLNAENVQIRPAQLAK
jgi:hypothetical protein